mmetsp:Transcript_87079/g.243709  ORF Transcript_87079/g.243709 Transcript_87079/m.243709 type:complete len:244 (-) Transcript_87079:183-914(-)
MVSIPPVRATTMVPLAPHAKPVDFARGVRRDCRMDGEEPPVFAGVPLSARTLDNRLASPLHPPTALVFEQTRKRQAYGSVAPRENPVKHPSGSDHSVHEEEARRRWWKAYVNDCEKRSHHDARLHPSRPRSLGASGQLGHAESSETGWHWQSYRGWTGASRWRHEDNMREKWEREAQERWRNKAPEASLAWRPEPHDLQPFLDDPTRIAYPGADGAGLIPYRDGAKITRGVPWATAGAVTAGR